MDTLTNRRLLLAIILLSLLPSFLHAQAPQVSRADAETLEEAQAAFEEKDYEEVVELLTPLRKKYPNLGEVPRFLAHAYYELGQTDQAREMALAAISVGRMTSDVMARLAMIDEKRKDQLALASTVQLLTILEPENNAWRLLQADLLASAQEFDESTSIYRTLLEEEPERGELHLRIGNAQLQQGKYDQAVQTLETAWHLGMENAKLAKNLAGLWYQQGNTRRALAWTQRALSFEETADDPKLQLQLAQHHIELQQWDAAAEVATPLRKSEDAQIKPQAHLILAQVALQREQVEQAVHHWQQAVDAGFEAQKLLLALGAHYFNHQQYPKAAQYLQQALQDDDFPSEQPLRFLILSLLNAGDRPTARSYLRMYLEHHHQHENADKLIRRWIDSADGVTAK